MPKVPLTKLSGELAKQTGKPSIPYRRLYLWVLDGKIPAEQDPVTGRYTVDVRAAADALGMTNELAAA
jgi:hypothetical protein